VKCSTGHESVHEIFMLVSKLWDYNVPHLPRILIVSKGSPCMGGIVVHY